MHLLVESAGIIGFAWDPVNAGWSRPGLPVLQHLVGPYQHFKAAIWDAWKLKVSFDLCRRQGFRGGPLLDIAGSLQLLHAPHVRERDKALLRSIMVGGVWNGFLLGHARGEIVPCRFCGGADGDGHLFWECPHLPLVQIRENPEFHHLIRRDRLAWHGWLPALNGSVDLLLLLSTNLRISLVGTLVMTSMAGLSLMIGFNRSVMVTYLVRLMSGLMVV